MSLSKKIGKLFECDYPNTSHKSTTFFEHSSDWDDYGDDMPVFKHKRLPLTAYGLECEADYILEHDSFPDEGIYMDAVDEEVVNRAIKNLKYHLEDKFETAYRSILDLDVVD